MEKIDPHVHCRDGKEAYKTNIREVSELAREQGVAVIFDMPNTDPPILTKQDVESRLRLARSRNPVVGYFLYVGLTSDESQIREAVEAVNQFPEVVGLKLYAARSAGLGVPRPKDQARIYRILTKLNYKGVLAVHAEKESKFKPNLWDPQKSWTHSLARPPKAEIESVRDQIKFAAKANFQGNLHICHISCPEAVDLVWTAKRELRITSGATPHNILLTSEELEFYSRMCGKSFGLLFKVNPPIRDSARVEALRKRLLDGKIDWIETDHARHGLEEKIGPPYLSGIASLSLYQRCLAWLGLQGMSQGTIENMTYWNIKKAFAEKLKEV